MNRRILIVNVNWIGDVLFSTPFIRSVRESYPHAYIACMLHPRCKEMLEYNPHLDELIIYDEEGAHQGLIGKIKLILKLRAKKFDVAFLLHRSFTKALMVYLAGIAERIGYPTKNRAKLLTKTVEAPDEEIHKVEYFLNIARSALIRPRDESYQFFVTDEDRKHISSLLSRNGISEDDKVVVLCPGGNWDPKRWPKENFAKLGDLIVQKTGCRIVISGARKDETLAWEVGRTMTQKNVITAGKTTLRQLGALLERARLVIANDSGPMHMAVAMKTPTIALFGPTSPLLTGPYGKGNYRVIAGKTESRDRHCQVPCYDMTCDVNDCMRAIGVPEVLSVAREMLN